LAFAEESLLGGVKEVCDDFSTKYKKARQKKIVVENISLFVVFFFLYHFWNYL